MFTSAGRSRLRESLIALAREDADVVGAAVVGSAARGAEDEWSDIDLVLQLARDADETAGVDRFTLWMDAEEGTADPLDVMAGGVRYRVFMLRELCGANDGPSACGSSTITRATTSRQ